MSLRTIGIAVVSALALVMLAQAESRAGTLALDSVAAAIAAPIITGPQGEPNELTVNAVTLVTLTNAGPGVVLHVNVISGDAGDNWQAQDFECIVTEQETVLFVFEPNGTGSLLSYECNLNRDLVVQSPFLARNGILFISLEDPVTGLTLNADRIFADWVVLDGQAGAAFSSGAVPFQGGLPGGGVPDRSYRFDGLEYRQFPSALATNFVAPDADISAYLVLFTLDGSAGSPAGGPPASVSVRFYNDDEIQFSTGYAFSCFSIVELRTIDPRFASAALGSLSGHMTLTPQLVVYPDLAHDAQYDGGGVIGVRKPPVHGWLVQTVGVGGVFGGAGRSSFARPLAQAQLPLEPSTGDTPTFGGR